MLVVLVCVVVNVVNGGFECLVDVLIYYVDVFVCCVGVLYLMVVVKVVNVVVLLVVLFDKLGLKEGDVVCVC